MAATFEKANTYVLAETVIHNPKVGSSILPPATNVVSSLQRPAVAAVRLLWGLLRRSAFAAAPGSPLRDAIHRRSRVYSAPMFGYIDGLVWP